VTPDTCATSPSVQEKHCAISALRTQRVGLDSRANLRLEPIVPSHNLQPCVGPWGGFLFLRSGTAGMTSIASATGHRSPFWARPPPFSLRLALPVTTKGGKHQDPQPFFPRHADPPPSGFGSLRGQRKFRTPSRLFLSVDDVCIASPSTSHGEILKTAGRAKARRRNRQHSCTDLTGSIGKLYSTKRLST
jgi:hypothetical protein